MITETYLNAQQAVDSLGILANERAAEYTAGNIWLSFWQLVIIGLIAKMMAQMQLMEFLAQYSKRLGWLQPFSLALICFGLFMIMGLPWIIYADWLREASYGHSTQPLLDFLNQYLLSSSLFIIGLAVTYAIAFALYHRYEKFWKLCTSLFLIFAMIICMGLWPIYGAPLFNHYKPLPEGPVRAAILPVTQAAGISSSHIYMFDGSRQSIRVDARIEGVGETRRIAVSDISMESLNPREMRMLVGHYAGHYANGHIWWMLAVLAVLTALFFVCLDYIYILMVHIIGSSARLGEIRALPALIVTSAFFYLLASPFYNFSERIGEGRADHYALNVGRDPDAMVSLLLKQAGDIDPRPAIWQEAFFYSSLSLEKRIEKALQWKAAHAGRRDI